MKTNFNITISYGKKTPLCVEVYPYGVEDKLIELDRMKLPRSEVSNLIAKWVYAWMKKQIDGGHQ